MSAASFPLSIEIGATLSSSVGAALRSTEAQLGRIGEVMGRLENASLGASRLETLRQQAAEAGRAWRAQQAEIEKLQAAKASGQWTTKGLDAARARVSALEAKAADPALSEAKRARAAAALETARQRLAEQEAKAEARYARQLDHLVEKAGKAKTAYEQIKASVANLTTELQKSGVATNKLASEQAHLGSTMETLRARTEALTRAQQAQASNLEQRSAYRAQLMDAVALGGALYGLVQPAVQFESVMADVKKVVNFDTPDQFGQMSKDVLLLSTRIPMAADGIGAIVAAAGQAGIAREELLRFAEDAAKMGVAFDLTGEQAGAAMTGLRSIFGLTQDEVVKLGDAINHLSNNMDAKASDLLNIANRAGSTAKLFGLSGAQLNALGATFLALKTPPEVAATGINALLMKLATADKQNEKFQQGLQDIGLSAEVMKKMIQRDAQGALTTFLRQVKNAPDLMGTLSDLFGAEYADDIAKLVGSMETYEKAVGLVADQTAYAGSMQAEYEARSATTANSLQLLKNQATRLMVTIGSALLPGLNALVGAVSGPIESVADLARQFPLLTQVVVGATAGLMALKVAGMGLGYAWTFVRGGATMAWMGVERVRAALALARVEAIKAPVVLNTVTSSFWRMLPAIGATTAALLANPITWVVAGIGAAVAGLALVIRKYWEPLSAWIGGFWDGIKEGVAPAIEGIGQALAPLAPIGSAIAAAFSVVGDAVSGVVGWMSELLAPVSLAQDEFEGLASSGKSVGMTVGQTLGAAFHALTLPLQAVAALVDLVGAGITKLGEAADWVSSRIDKVAEIGSSIAGFFAPEKSSPTPAPAATPMLRPQPVSRTTSIASSISAPITINAPAGSDAREIARLVDERLRQALRDQGRRTNALYD